jgi:hypothetical protein
LSAGGSNPSSGWPATVSLAKPIPVRLTIPITTAGDGGSVQQRLSAAGQSQRLANAAGAADKLYSLNFKEMIVRQATYYRAQHVTGPGCVLVSIRFGKTPESGPHVIRLLGSNETESAISFDLENHIKEILSGVDAANTECGGALQVEEIQVVPDDYPKKGQAEYAAYKIACGVLRHEI